jgi:hypothetical protein
MILNQQVVRLGFTRLDLLILAALAAVAVVLLPLLARSNRRPPSARIACMNNLKQVGLAYRQWAIDNNDKYPMRVSVTNGGAMETSGGRDVYLNFLVMSNERIRLRCCFVRRTTVGSGRYFAQSLPPNASPSAALS